MQTYINSAQLPFPFCPGCSHGVILKSLDKALVELDLDPHKIVIVTDIGCAGLSDRYFSTNAFHGLHGRSTTYATGIKIANPELKVIVLIGDGGCGIGGHHLLNAARRNIGITTLVFNNLNYGMTGGEHSVTTPLGSITSTTASGQIEQPFDICSTMAVNGANFVARATAFEKNLEELILKALETDGFSLIDIWEFCTAYYVPNNRFSKKVLLDTLKKLNMPTGILHAKKTEEFSHAYQLFVTKELGKSLDSQDRIPQEFSHNLNEQKSIILSGAAGTKISSTATIFSKGAMRSGLWVTQRDDYPVTVKTGHSISEIIVSPTKIKSTAVHLPDVLLVLFPEGLEKSRSLISQLNEENTLIMSTDLPAIKSKARKIILDFSSVDKSSLKKEYRGIMAINQVLKILKFYPQEALINAIKTIPKFADQNLAAVSASEKIDIKYL
jgi:2-oxoglutarate ferredoxin oxidoreductase subunit beta